MTCKAIGCDTDLREACVHQTPNTYCPCFCHGSILTPFEKVQAQEAVARRDFERLVLPSPESRKPFDDLVSQTQAEITRALPGAISKLCRCPKPGRWSTHQCAQAQRPDEDPLTMALNDRGICECACHGLLNLTIDEDEDVHFLGRGSE